MNAISLIHASWMEAMATGLKMCFRHLWNLIISFKVFSESRTQSGGLKERSANMSMMSMCLSSCPELSQSLGVTLSRSSWVQGTSRVQEGAATRWKVLCDWWAFLSRFVICSTSHGGSSKCKSLVYCAMREDQKAISVHCS